MSKITKRLIDSAEFKTREFHWDEGDGALKGFGVRRAASGIASYIVQYRWEGDTRRYAFARVGTITPDQAREEARGLLARAVKEDLSESRKKARKAETFKELVEEYQHTEKWTRKNANARAIDQGRIDRHLLPLLSGKKAKSITHDDMEAVFRAIRDGKTAVDRPSGKLRGRIRVQGGEGTARRTLGLAGAIFSFGVKKGIVEANPCQRIDAGRDGVRETIVEDAEAYGRLFRAIGDLQTAREISNGAADALRLIALTGARRGEITGLRWRNVDLANGRLVLQADQHKTGRATGKAKSIALPAKAQEILAALQAGEPNALVIKAAKLDAEIDLKKAWGRVREKAGLPASLTIHGLRHSIASHFAMGGATGPELQAQMGHANIKTSARYIHFAEQKRNTLAERAASVATAGLAASEGAPEGEVIQARFGHAGK